VNLNDVLKTVRIETPLPVLASNWAVICSCGYTREYGYMYLTADRVADQHANRGHDVELFEWAADPLPRSYTVKRLKVQRGVIHGTISTGTRADSPVKINGRTADDASSEGQQEGHQDPEASHLVRHADGLRRTDPNGPVPADSRRT